MCTVPVLLAFVITARIARSAKCRYVSYSETDFEVFRHAGATRCTDGGEICNDKGIPKTEIFIEI